MEIGIAHDFAANKLVLEIGVDDACRLWCFGSLSDSPGTNFIRSAGEIPNQLSTSTSQVSKVDVTKAMKRAFTSKEVYPACVILPNALVAPRFFSSSALSSADNGARRSSSATEKGMRGSPGLLASIQALILGNLR